jgi:hypothetical protein
MDGYTRDAADGVSVKSVRGKLKGLAKDLK